MFPNVIHLIERGNISGVKSYVSDNKNWINSEKRNAAFLYSCKLLQIDISTFLLDYTNPNCRYADGQSALMLLSQNSTMPTNTTIKDVVGFMEVLIERGCEIDLVDYCGKTALHWAAICNNSAAVRILTKQHCNVNSVDILGYTAVMYAAKMNNATVVTLLLHSGADLTKCSKFNGGVVHLAVRHGSEAALRQMLPFCRHLNILDSHNRSPIDLSVLAADLSMTRLLMVANVDLELNRRPSYAPFRTPLEEACFRNNMEIVTLLLSAGADTNHSLEFAFELDDLANRSQPVTPLVLAVGHGNQALVTLLLEHKADPHMRCPKRPGFIVTTTPLELAIELKHNDIVSILSRSINSSIQFSQTIGTSQDCNQKKRKSPQKPSESHTQTLESALLQWEVTSATTEAPMMAALRGLNLPLVLDLLPLCPAIADLYLVNGVPAILCLFKDPSADVEPVLSGLSRDSARQLVSVSVAVRLSGVSTGGSMQGYREAWLRLVADCQRLYAWPVLSADRGGDCDDHSNRFNHHTNNGYCRFVVNFLSWLFLKKSMLDDWTLMESRLRLLDVFDKRLVRRAMHSSQVIRTALYSKSLTALRALLNAQLDDSLIYLDIESDLSPPNTEDPESNEYLQVSASHSLGVDKMELCELALFFDNLDAALLFNIVCNSSLRCIVEFDQLTYTPDTLNPLLEFNEPIKIKAIQTLSRMVKPLRSLCLYSARKSLLLGDSNQLFAPNSLRTRLRLDLGEFTRNYRNDMVSDLCFEGLCEWACLDSDTVGLLGS